VRRSDRAGMALCALARAIGSDLKCNALAAALRRGVESGHGELFTTLVVALTAVMHAASGAEGVPRTWDEMWRRYRDAVAGGDK